MNKQFTPEQLATIESYMKQGHSRETAERVVAASAKNRKPAARPGNLGYNKEFSLLR